MGISSGLPPGGIPTPPKSKNPNIELFTPQTDILTGSKKRTNHYILKTRSDARLAQADAITNFKKADKVFLPGASGILKKAIKTFSLGDLDQLEKPGGTDFLQPDAIAGIRIKKRPGGKTIGTYIFVNDSVQGFQEESDAAFFLARYDLSKSQPFRYDNSLSAP